MIFHKALTSILHFTGKMIYVSAEPAPLAYELSGAATGRNADVEVTKGDALKFQLDTKGHPFWIKTVKGTGKKNGVPSGISGVGQGKTSGVLIWDTSKIMEGTYYYQCELAPQMVGRIIVASKKGITLFRI